METLEQPKEKKRLTLKELAVSPDAMKRIGQLIIERITNLGVVTRSGSSPTQCLMSEIVVLDAKVDALMQLLEERQGVDFTDLNEYIEKAATSGAATAVALRQQMMKK